VKIANGWWADRRGRPESLTRHRLRQSRDSDGRRLAACGASAGSGWTETDEDHGLECQNCARALRYGQSTPELRRAQFAVLLQIADHGGADRATLDAMMPGIDERVLSEALEHLLADGSIQGPAARKGRVQELAAEDLLHLTPKGRQRLDEDDV
jgi:hypothetical protein